MMVEPNARTDGAWQVLVDTSLGPRVFSSFDTPEEAAALVDAVSKDPARAGRVFTVSEAPPVEVTAMPLPAVVAKPPTLADDLQTQLKAALDAHLAASQSLADVLKQVIGALGGGA